MGPVGVQELVVIFLVALVLFGPKKLPELGKSIAKGLSEFRRAQSELKATFEGHMKEFEKEHESIKEVTSSYTSEIYNHYNEYDSSYHDTGSFSTESHPSIEANPSTVSAPASPGAESTVSHETPGHETVPRTNSPAATAERHDPGTASPDSHPVNS